MRTADLDYGLPQELIAQEPIEPRDAARLMVVNRADGSLAHRYIRDLPELLAPGDLLVANRSRVLPARIRGHLLAGGRAELLLLRRLADGHWEALVRPARRLRVGDRVSVDSEVNVRIERELPEGLREISIQGQEAELMAHGEAPLPPYIQAWHGDPERYQTIFADVDGSAAAPTAGLHFTPALVDAIKARGVCVDTLLLHIGLDTFRPIAEADPREHRIHSEWYSVPSALQIAIAETRAHGHRIVAIGTTTVRALETWAATGQAEGATTLFITPGFEFKAVDAMLTNFHLPRSTLLLLVSAFAGRERVLAAYAEAVRERYRFYSFGDAMLVG
ncbi:MAG TPA: tRNA preQ1(34) S-adenosylmethionine ribosyltransferase-isomerase QueA [Chloroflexota bacterium]|jgi:S-adenosylmethionine:tRNA ribosyltransferase-isomerase|nr:tRNA preQ1(34) S-adenosylmethionine ribosyltransferase-isomerase QueA [Chloroflexota bacterium]